MLRVIAELSNLKLMMLATAAYSDDQISRSVARLAEASARKTLEAASKLPTDEKGNVELLMARVLVDAQAPQSQDTSMDYNEERIE
jgi:F0F1-type ATP synthase epsilon subunit